MPRRIRREDAEIDEVDRQILAHLLDEGRAGPSDLGRAAGVATSTATKRLQRLEERGVVEGYRPDVDYGALGYGVTVVFRLDVAGEGLEDVVADLQRTGRMVGVYEVTGNDDVVAVGKFEDVDAMNAQVSALLAREHVDRVATSVVRDVACEGDSPQVPTETPRTRETPVNPE